VAFVVKQNIPPSAIDISFFSAVGMMVKGGTLRLDAIQTYKFPMTEINEAIDQAATLKGTDYCVLAINDVDC
jgi:hypothetical protein